MIAFLSTSLKKYMTRDEATNEVEDDSANKIKEEPIPIKTEVTPEDNE